MTDLIYLFSDSGFSGIADVVLKKKPPLFSEKGHHEGFVQKLDESFLLITRVKTSFLLEVILGTESFLEVPQGKQSKHLEVIRNDSKSCSTA